MPYYMHLLNLRLKLFLTMFMSMCAMNWYFIAASVLVYSPPIYWVTMRFVIPRLGSYDDSNSDIQVDDENTGLTTEENRCILGKYKFFIMIALLIILAIPQGSF